MLLGTAAWSALPCPEVPTSKDLGTLCIYLTVWLGKLRQSVRTLQCGVPAPSQACAKTSLMSSSQSFPPTHFMEEETETREVEGWVWMANVLDA